MSLVPFASSTPASAPPVVSRAAPAASARPAVGGPSRLASPRAQAVTRDGAAAATTRGRSGFASVLAEVQDQATAHVPTPRESEASARTSRMAVEAEGAPACELPESGDMPMPGHATRVPPSPEPQTPWLLLALGVGGWSEAMPPGDGGPAESTGGDEDPSGTTAAPVASTAGVVAADVAPPVAAPGVGADVMAILPSALPLPGATSAAAPEADAPALPDPGASLSAAPVVTRAATTGVPVDHAMPPAGEQVGTEAPLLGALRVAASPDGQIATDPAAPDELASAAPAVTATAAAEVAEASGLASAEAIARWRVARRGAEGTREFAPPAIGLERDPGAPSPSAPGAAVSRLAQALGQAAAAQGDEAVPTGPSEALLAPTSGSNAPTARATEVLLRLAQEGGLPARKASEGTVVSSAFAQMVGTAMAPTPVDVSPAAPAPAPPLPPAAGEQVLAQLVSSMKLQWKDGVGEAKLHLRPDALGHVTITMRVEAGAVTAVVRAENPQVQEWILQHQPSLRQQMEAAGLHLDELVVSPDDRRESQGRSQEQAEDSPRRRAPRETDDARGDGSRFETLL